MCAVPSKVIFCSSLMLIWPEIIIIIIIIVVVVVVVVIIKRG